MLTHWAKARYRLATIFVAIYAVCVLAPVVALAAEGHCLTESSHMGAHHHVAASHDHSHGDAGHTHRHADGVNQASHISHDGDDAGPAGKCCALMFFSAITPELDVAPAPAELSSLAFAGIMQPFSGIPPGKLVRPPKPRS